MKRTRIAAPGPSLGFGTTRLMAPTPWRRDEATLRVFCGFCDDAGISRPGYFDLDARDPSRILGFSRHPVMELGGAGAFDENGLCPSCVLAHGGKLLMYYFGFAKTAARPVPMFSGLAESKDFGETFRRVQEAPVLGPTDEEPLMRSAPYVEYSDGIFQAYYPCALGSVSVEGKPIFRYHLRRVDSRDGVHWGREGTLAVDLMPGDDEFGLGRPWGMRSATGFRLIYSVRTRSLGYRLGCADSDDGWNFVRRDAEMDVPVTPAKDAWDHEMICYGATCAGAGKTFLFYNGNGLGNTGFGFAEMSFGK